MRKILLLSLLAASTTAYAAPDEDALCRGSGYPYPRSRSQYTMQDCYKIGEFTHVEEILETRKVSKGADVFPLLPTERPLAITYKFRGKVCTVDDFLDHQRVTGLLIIKDGKIVVERYQYDRQPEMRFMSNSMAKSITSLLIGIAVKDGKIRSLDDTVEQYVPKLSGSVYAKITLQNLLSMSSGVKFHQSYSGDSDNERLNRNTMNQKNWGGVSAVSFIDAMETTPGTKFNYSGGDTFVLGLVLQGALGKQTLADYTSEKLWSAIGAEDDASWGVDYSGAALTHAAFNARLRDYGRLGVMLANDGQINGKQVVDKEYLVEATDYARHPNYMQPGILNSWGGYGYQFWIHNYKTRTFSMQGAFGQFLVVQPESKVVIVITAATKEAEEKIPERGTFITQTIKALGGKVEVIR